MLLLDANRTVSREQIIDALWGASVPASAAKMVQIHVSQLRKLLPEPRLRTRGAGYMLEVRDDEVDLRRFERMVADGRRALAGEDVRRARQLLGNALALWRGRALAEFSEPFAAHEAPPSIPCVSGCAPSTCSRSTGRAVMPRRSPPTRHTGERWPTSSAWSPRRPSESSSG